MPIALLKFPNDLLREVFRLCNPFELQTDNPENYYKTIFGGCDNYMDIEFPNGGVVELFLHLLDTFGIRIVHSLGIKFTNFEDFLKIAKDLVDRNIEIEQFAIENDGEVQDVVNFMPMLNQMNITQELQCSMKFPPDFHFDFVKYPREISISNSSWFTFDQLMDCTSARVELKNSLFTNHDLDVFLQKWKKTGTFPNLRRLRIHSIQIDIESPIQEMILPIQNVDNPMIRVLMRNYIYPNIFNPVRVSKDDGTEGWLKVDVGNWPEFNFLM
ncbi:hypothetical protein B9Z55_027154 [Caenorhabditis nigoni]|uniref:Sdz-33 F-box domain-containing protein n=1 Tax=Caenorhabditis nigoni TaxID=1611254 RepID=A0A2G5SH01_9PELO|nr:hypothetical protein B9Z55_027154 [Caenorhabditis nigoni]